MTKHKNPAPVTKGSTHQRSTLPVEENTVEWPPMPWSMRSLDSEKRKGTSFDKCQSVVRWLETKQKHNGRQHSSDDISNKCQRDNLTFMHMDSGASSSSLVFNRDQAGCSSGHHPSHEHPAIAQQSTSRTWRPSTQTAATVSHSTQKLQTPSSSSKLVWFCESTRLRLTGAKKLRHRKRK